MDIHWYANSNLSHLIGLKVRNIICHSQFFGIAYLHRLNFRHFANISVFYKYFSIGFYWDGIFFIVARRVLCFEFVSKMVLITHCNSLLYVFNWLYLNPGDFSILPTDSLLQPTARSKRVAAQDLEAYQVYTMSTL